jgi:hypothetical protein
MPEELQPDDPKFNEPLPARKLLDWLYTCRDDSKGFFDGGTDSPWGEADYFSDVNASESFSKSELDELKKSGRPNIDPPFAAGVIEAVVGAEIAQEVEPVFVGVDQGFEDGVIADWLTTLVRNGFSKSGARDKMLEAFHDKCNDGYGFVHMYLDLHYQPPHLKIEKLNYWNVWPDPDAVAANLSDARWWVLETEWDLEEAQGNWKTAEQRAALAGAVQGGGQSGILPRVPASSGASVSHTGRRNRVTILEFQYRRSVEMAYYVDPETGEDVKATRDEYEKRKKELAEAADLVDKDYEETLRVWEMAQADPILAQQAEPTPPEPPQSPRIDEEYEQSSVQLYSGYAYRRAFACGDSGDTSSLLEDKEIDLPLPGGEPGFTIKCDTGYGWKQRKKQQRVRRFGLMRKIVHIQEFFTKFLHMYIEQMGRKIRGGGFVEVSAFEGVPGGFEKFVKNSPKGGMWNLVADGAILGGKIRENPALQGEPGLQEAVYFMKELFAWVTGVSQALQGTMTQDRSNVLTENMQAQGLQMLLPIRNPRKSFLLSCGRLYAAIALKHLPAEELDRILGAQEVEGMTTEPAVDPMTGQPQVGPNGKPVMQPMVGEDGEPMTAGKILKKANLLDYDLTADLAAVNDSQKLRFTTVWNQHGLGQILKDALPGAEGSRIWVPRLLKNLPLPAQEAKAMAAESEALLDKMAASETQEGILQAFQNMMQGDPEAAQQLHGQIMQLVEQAGVPEGAEPAQ